MTLLSLPVAMAAAVTAYVGLNHLWLHFRRPRRSDLFFALTCLCMVAYDLSGAILYSATDDATAALWQRATVVFVTAMGLPFILFVNEHAGIRTPRWATWALSAFPVFATIGAIERRGWILTDIPLPKEVVSPFGVWVIREFSVGPLFVALTLSVPFMVFYCLWVALGAPVLRKGHLSKTIEGSLELGMAAVVLLMSLSHDLLMNFGVLQGPYLFEYGFLGVAVVMSWGLSNEIWAARHTRHTLEVTERRESTILSAIQDAVITTDLEGQITHLNPAAERLLALPLQTVEGHPLRDYIEITCPETDKVVLDPISYAVGRQFNPYGKLPQLVTCDGNERRIDLGGAPLHDESGRLTGALVVMRDLTLQHQALSSLQHAKKMESMGQLAGGTAHDLNNLLTPIMSYVELVQKEVPTESKSARFLEHVQEATTRAAGLTRQLLALSRKQVLDVHVVPLAEFVRQTIPLLQRLVGENIVLRAELSPHAGHVRIDLGQFEQVLLNLTSNARDAMKDQGTITIRVRALSDLEASLEVTDTGVGMDRSTVTRIFEPFFTTKERGKGTGLGLASVRGIVEQHGGSIYVDSEPGEGTSIEIVLPTTQAEQRKSSIRSAPRGEFIRGEESILVVEDDAAVRLLAKDALEQLGYRVFLADGLATATAIAESERLDLLLTDVVLLGADGPRVREAVQALQDVPCLFMTGHADDRLGERGVVARGTEVLRKPFTVQKLGQKVRQVLDREKKRRSISTH